MREDRWFTRPLGGQRALTGHALLPQVLQRQADGVVLHGAGDDVGQGPVHWAGMPACVPVGGMDFVEVLHHGLDY